jgi:hypothetical protein
MSDSPGVHNPKKIDLITRTKTDEIVLVMIEDRPWDGGEDRLAELQDKINNYLAFALDGALFQQIPEAKDKRVIIRLDCSHEPDTATLDFIDAVRRQIEPEHIPITINVR